MMVTAVSRGVRGALRFPALVGFARTTWSSPRRSVAMWLFLPSVVFGTLFAGHVAALRLIGSFLVVDEPLQPAAAIIVLAGQMPVRETEAAAIYRDGWARQVVLVPGADMGNPRVPAAVPDWQARRDLLVRLGVPAEAITVADGRASGTFEELELAERAIEPNARRVILVTSKFHTRRVISGWELSAPASMEATVRVARRDPFDPNAWWRDAQMRAVVVHEYLGLLELGMRRVWPGQLDPTKS